MLRDFAILHLSSSFVNNHLPSVFHMHFSICSSLLCIRESPQPVLYDVLFFLYHSESAWSRNPSPYSLHQRWL